MPDPFSLAQEAEIQDLIAAFGSKEPTGTAVAELEVLVRAAIFKPANELVGALLQQAVDRIDESSFLQASEHLREVGGRAFGWKSSSQTPYGA